MKRKSPNAPWTIDYFWDRSIPEPNSGCWIWLGATSHGYGVVRHKAKNIGAHRLAYELYHSVSVPSSVDICHRCDNRACVNPLHLFEGTRLENMHDCISKGRFAYPEPLCGEDSPNSKLTDMDVLEIRSDPRSQRAIARAYGVDKATVAHIVHRRTWRHI